MNCGEFVSLDKKLRKSYLHKTKSLALRGVDTEGIYEEKFLEYLKTEAYLLMDEAQLRRYFFVSCLNAAKDA